MDVGVNTMSWSGVIVNSSARAADAAHFFADEPRKKVVHQGDANNGQLVIVD